MIRGEDDHHRGPHRRHVVSALASAALLALAACGSGTDAQQGGGVTTAEQLAQAHDFTAAAEHVPAAITVTEPLTARPTPGKTFVYLQGTDTVSAAKLSAVEEAATAVGWDVKVLRFDNSDPATQVSAMQTALQFKPHRPLRHRPPQPRVHPEQGDRDLIADLSRPS
jgi:hypothetical protein